MNVYEFAARTADVIERCGHTRHKYYDRATGGVCLQGAERLVLTGTFAYPHGCDTRVATELNKLIELEAGTSDVVTWNDYIVRDGAEVIATLRAIAARDPNKQQSKETITEPELVLA